jgi:putative tricarboxylic transport membrane protein
MTGPPTQAPPTTTRPNRRRLAPIAPFVVAAVVTVVLVATVIAAATSDDSATDARAFLNGRQLRIMAPAAPGGGWDQTAREMQSALRDIVGRSEVYNVAGAGGTVGLSQYARLSGHPTELMVMGLVMVGAIANNRSPVTLDQTTRSRG